MHPETHQNPTKSALEKTTRFVIDLGLIVASKMTPDSSDQHLIELSIGEAIRSAAPRPCAKRERHAACQITFQSSRSSRTPYLE